VTIDKCMIHLPGPARGTFIIRNDGSYCWPIACRSSVSSSAMRACNFSITGATCLCENRLWMCCGQFVSHASIVNRMARSTFPG